MTVRLRVPPVDDPDFTAEVTYLEGAALRLAGSADRTATSAFAELLATLHDELRAKRTKVIVVDMHAVDFMHASCFKELVTWVSRLQELEPGDRYTIRLRSNPSILWQRHSLAALSCFDTDIIEFETT